MPIYPPRNTSVKKEQIFNYRVYELVKSIKENEAAEKIEKRAEAVRLAMLNLIKAREHLNKSYKSEGATKVSKQLSLKLISDKNDWVNYDYEAIKEFCLKMDKV